MKVLVVGAGAAGGYLGAQLDKAGRNVRFLVHQHTLERLDTQGLRLRSSDGITALPVRAVTASTIEGAYDVIVLAVRSDVVDSAINDIRTVVAPHTRIVPLVNGVAHLSLLSAAFGEQVVLGAAVRLATSMLADGTIDVVAPGIDLELGQLDGRTSAIFDAVVREFRVDSVTVNERPDMIAAMWEKFAFITATAALTCLTGNVIGVVARAAGGPALGRRIADEVSEIAAAEGYALADAARVRLVAALTDPDSTFAPSMFRDLTAHRRVEISVLADLADRARRHHIDTPLLDAALVVIDILAGPQELIQEIRTRVVGPPL
jgi:2-dehydropantoate 2-reductase